MTPLEHSPIFDTYARVVRYQDSIQQNRLEAIIRIADTGEEITPVVLKSCAIERDYVRGFTDEITCTVVLPIGQFAKRVYTHRTNLEVILRRTKLVNGTGQVDYDADIDNEVFSATLKDDNINVGEMQGSEIRSEEVLNLMGLIDVTFQLTNKANEQLRTMLVGGIHRGSISVKDATLFHLQSCLSAINVDDKRKVKNIDWIEENNKTLYPQLSIQHGLHVVDLPGWMQARLGVYSAGLGSYIQNGTWYIFPLYDNTRFEKTLNTLTVYLLPKKRFAEIDRSWMVDGSETIILINSDTNFKGQDNVSKISAGSGARYANAQALDSSSHRVEGNKAFIKRPDNASEYTTEQMQGTVNYAPMSAKTITSNPYPQFSELAQRNGGWVAFNWQHSVSTLLTPGMVTRIVYYDGDIIKYAHGVLHSHRFMSANSGGYTSGYHVNVSQLVFFVQTQN